MEEDPELSEKTIKILLPAIHFHICQPKQQIEYKSSMKIQLLSVKAGNATLLAKRFCFGK